MITLRPPQASVEYRPQWIQTTLVLVADQVFSAPAALSRVGHPHGAELEQFQGRERRE